MAANATERLGPALYSVSPRDTPLWNFSKIDNVAIVADKKEREVHRLGRNLGRAYLGGIPTYRAHFETPTGYGFVYTGVNDPIQEVQEKGPPSQNSFKGSGVTLKPERAIAVFGMRGLAVREVTVSHAVVPDVDVIFMDIVRSTPAIREIDALIATLVRGKGRYKSLYDERMNDERQDAAFRGGSFSKDAFKQNEVAWLRNERSKLLAPSAVPRLRLV